jgi:uncharacterized protein (DUF2147 family)
MKEIVIRTCIALSILGSSLNAFADTETANSLVGVWETVDNKTGKAKSHVKIWNEKGRLFGKIVKLIDPSEKKPICTKCTGEHKDASILGMVVMKDLKKDGDEWNGGTILDPESGNTYNVIIKAIEDGKKLKVRGYIGVSIMGRTQYWNRVK